MHRYAIVASALVVASCGFGHDVVRPDLQTVIENRGMNRYVYRIVRTEPVPPRGPATPWVGGPPPGSHEVAGVFVRVQMSGWGVEGYRWSEEEFFPALGWLAGELGGDHFGIVRVIHDRWGWLRGIDVSVTAVDDPSLASADSRDRGAPRL